MMNKDEILSYFEVQAKTGEWDSLYDKNNPASYPFIVRFVKAINLIKQVENNSVLDLGCGTGILIPYVIENKGKYIGLDNSESMLKTVNKKFSKLIENGNVSLHLKDIREFTPSEKFDIIIGLGFIEYFDDPETVVEQLYELLPKGGQLILSFPNFKSLDYFNLQLTAPIRFLLRKLTGRHTISPPRKMWNSKYAKKLFSNAGFQDLNIVNYNVNIFSYPFTRISIKFTNFWANKFEYSFLSKIGIFSSGFIIMAVK